MKLEDITLDWLQARVREDEDGCWIWTGSNDGGNPKARINYKLYPVRQIVWRLLHDWRKFPNGRVSGVSCDKANCVHPDHVIAADHGHTLSGTTRPLVVKAKITKAMRENSGIQQETVEAIRSSELDNRKAAEKFELPEEYVRQVRKYLRRRDYSNPFAGLGA